MIRSLLLLTIVLLFAVCGLFDNGKCKEPDSGCNNCIRIYNSDGDFVAEGDIDPVRGVAYWNGTDCNGDSLPCGKYTSKVVYNGRHFTEETVLSSPGAIKKNDRKACDSLKAACKGFYYEKDDEIFGLSCLCCGD